MKLYILVIIINVSVMGRREISKRSVYGIMELDLVLKVWVNLIVRGRREI